MVNASRPRATEAPTRQPESRCRDPTCRFRGLHLPSGRMRRPCPPRRSGLGVDDAVHSAHCPSADRVATHRVRHGRRDVSRLDRAARDPGSVPPSRQRRLGHDPERARGGRPRPARVWSRRSIERRILTPEHGGRHGRVRTHIRRRPSVIVRCELTTRLTQTSPWRIEVLGRGRWVQRPSSTS
jgi:hypothetical protein